MDPRVIRNLWAVKEAIVIEPRSFDMTDWCYTDVDDCGTTLCIAGHYALLRGLSLKAIESGFYNGRFRALMQKDLPKLEPGTGVFCNLFYLDNWPVDLQVLYASNPVLAGQKAIDWYIALHATPEEIVLARNESMTFSEVSA